MNLGTHSSVCGRPGDLLSLVCAFGVLARRTRWKQLRFLMVSCAPWQESGNATTDADENHEALGQASRRAGDSHEQGTPGPPWGPSRAAWLQLRSKLCGPASRSAPQGTLGPGGWDPDEGEGTWLGL